MKTKVKTGPGLYPHTTMAGTIVNGTGIYGGLPVSQYEGKARLNLGKVGADDVFWMLWRTFGDALRATALGYHVANSNTQPKMVLGDIDLTVSLDTWYFVLSNLKPDFRYLDCFETFIEYVAAYVQFFSGTLTREQRAFREATPGVQDMEESDQEQDDDDDFGAALTLDAIADAFFDSPPVGDCAQGGDEFNYVIFVDQILEPMVRAKFPAGTPAPPGPSIEYDPDILAGNEQTFRTLEESMKFYEAAARIIPRALAIAAWGEYALKKVIDVRKTLSYNSLVFDFTNAVANFLYNINVIGFADDIEVDNVDFIPDLELPSENDARDADRRARQAARKGKTEVPGQTPEERPVTRGRGGETPVEKDENLRLRSKLEKRVMREIETVAIILSRPGNLDKIEEETTRGRIAEVIDSSFGVRLQQLLASLPFTPIQDVSDREAELETQKLNLEKAIRKTEESIASPGQDDDVAELQEDLDGLRTTLTAIDEDIANLVNEIKEEEYLNAYRFAITQEPRAFLVDLFQQYERSVKKINAFVVKDASPDGNDDDDDKARASPSIGKPRRPTFFIAPGLGLTPAEITKFRPAMRDISNSVVRVQSGRLVLGPKLSITDVSASGEKYYTLTRTTDEDFRVEPTFIETSGWVDLFSFLYSTGELFLDWQRKLALDIDINSRLLTEEFFGLQAKPRATVSIANVDQIAKGNTTVADIVFKVGQSIITRYKTRIQ